MHVLLVTYVALLRPQMLGVVLLGLELEMLHCRIFSEEDGEVTMLLAPIPLRDEVV